jgi:mannose-1-phosphate guanylyltransferase
MPVTSVWAILLAAGDGTRLQGISRDESGRPAPKQYCSFGTGRSLLSQTLDRARRVADRRRVVSIVAEHHREWWIPALAEERHSEIIVQPRNRGTGPGILLPLWRIAHRDPGATVVLLPSDHFVEDEDLFAGSIRTATKHVARFAEDIVLLGVAPQAAVSDYGWIVPEPAEGPGPRRVSRFVEKPLPGVAARLMDQGGLWNSFVLAFRAWTLLDVYRRTQRPLWDLFSCHLDDPESRDLRHLYAEIPTVDFSRDILQTVPERLRVVRAPSCGWTDLGCPARLTSWQETRYREPAPEAILSVSTA